MSIGRKPDQKDRDEKEDLDGDNSDDEDDEDGLDGDNSDDEDDSSSDESANVDMSMSFEEIMNEIELVAHLQHPNIVKYHEYFINPSSAASALQTEERSGAEGRSEGRTFVYIVMDLLEGPTLVDALARLKGGYTEADVRILMERLLDAIHFMHLNGVTHRDLKLENLILKSKDGSDLRTVTVIDFGLAKAARARERMEDSCGTLWYYAPELVRGVPFLPVVDEYAAGVCMHILLSGEFPFDDEDEDVLEDLIIAADLSQIRDSDNDSAWSKVSAEARDLLLGLLNPAPMKRLTAKAALEHSFFSGSTSGDSGSLWHVHARLEKLSSQTTLPRRSFEDGEFLVDTVDDAGQQQLQRAPVKSLSSMSLSSLNLPDSNLTSAAEAPPVVDVSATFMIHEGVCEVLRVLRDKDDNLTFERVGFRRKGNFVSSDPSQILDIGRNPFGRSEVNNRRYAVRASGIVEVVVLDSSVMKWAQEHDFRLESELHKAMQSRRKILAALSANGNGTPPPPAAVPVVGGQSPGKPPRRDVNDIGISTMFAAGGEIAGAAASPRSLTGLSGDLRRLGGTTEEDQRKRFKIGLNVVLREYMEAGDIGEFARCLSELDAVCGFNKSLLVVKQAVSAALDRGNREKELVAVLLEALSPGMLSKSDMERGLAALACAAYDLAFDVPSSSSDIPIYLARAVITGTVARGFLVALSSAFWEEMRACETAAQVVEEAAQSADSLTPPYPEVPLCAESSTVHRQPSSFSSLLPRVEKGKQDTKENKAAVPASRKSALSLPAGMLPPMQLELPASALVSRAVHVSSPSFSAGHRFGIGPSKAVALLSLESARAGEKACARAMQLLSSRYESGVMDIWDREHSETVELLEEEFGGILDDFLAASDQERAINLDEAARKLWNMKVAHFHHAFVKQLMLRAVSANEVHLDMGLSLELEDTSVASEQVRPGDLPSSELLELLAFVTSSGLVSTTQLRLGYHRSEEHAHSECDDRDVPLHLSLSQLRAQARAHHGILV